MQRGPRPTLWQYLISILGGAMGVQSQNVRERDFRNGHPLAYIAGGIIFVLIFVVVLAIIAQYAAQSAGAG